MRRRAAAIGCILLACGSRAYALNPILDVTQYAHTSWKISDGVFKAGVIFDVTQTPDGYLWVATDSGLMRFDGVRSVPWQPPAGTRLPSSDIRTVHAARDGRLWIGTVRGVASWKDGTFTRYPALDGQVIYALIEDRQGTIWVGSGTLAAGRLCSIRNGTMDCYDNGGRFGPAVTAVYEDQDGNLWAAGNTDLWRWRPGPPVRYPMPDPDHPINALLGTDDGGVLVAKRTGITKLRNGKLESFPLRPGLGFKPRSLLRDRDGGLWIGAVVDGGLLHIHSDGRTDLYARSDGLSGNTVPAVFEDREGNVWAATTDGLDRFREYAVTTMDVEQGLSSHAVSSVVAAKDGTLWMATSGGLNKWENGHITAYHKRRGYDESSVTRRTAARFGDARVVRTIIDPGLPDDSLDSAFQDSLGHIWVTTHSGVAILRAGRFVPVASVPHGVVFEIAEDRYGTVWLSHPDGVFGLRDGRVVQRFSWATLGLREPATILVPDPGDESLWLGVVGSGVTRFKDGRVIASYPSAKGVTGLYFDSRGRLWAATTEGLLQIGRDRSSMLGRENGLPCSTMHWMIEDDLGAVWLYTACGLVRIERSEFETWASQPTSKIRTTVFDRGDGLRTQQFHFGYSAFLARSPDGKLWFTPSGGLSVVDPRHLPVNTLPPPVHVEQLTVNGAVYPTASGLRLPPHVRDLWIDYTALSFVAPEKVRFRYILEGQDRDWKEVVNDRQVQYSNLGPGSYRFRVVASNNSGVWNEAGASLEFSIAPAYYQTRGFAVLVAAAITLLLWLAYELRMRQMARQFNRTLAARVSERTRIARDLHDTLLQSFQGALLRFQSVAKAIPPDAVEATERLDRALDQAEAAITEGRNAVHGLRTSTTTLNDLANGITAIGMKLTSEPTATAPPVIQVEINGESRNLNPLIREEGYRIAGEALRNAVKHAHARRVTVTIHYEPRQLRVVVHDDGTGVDEQTMAQRLAAGHFGVAGMRERAAVIKGQLDVRSAPGAGTEIELRVPAAIAYDSSGRSSWWSRVVGLFLTAGLLLAFCPRAAALNAGLDVNQYAHTAWANSDGFLEGVTYAIAQTPDGYLWVGTEFGLLRFDGVRTVRWKPPAGQHLRSEEIRSLQGARDGRLWIGTARGLASWKDGELTHYPQLDGQIIEALLEDREGTIWVAAWHPSAGRLCRIQSGQAQCSGEDGRFGSGVTPLYEDSGGRVWAGAMNGLWRWKPGPPDVFPMPDPTQRIYALVESDDGGILIATHSGITKLKNGNREAYPLPAGFQPHRLFRDRDGGLWIGALVDKGLLHVHEGRTDAFTSADGLSGSSVNAIFEDREGNVWVGTTDGLDRFREYAIPTFADQQGLSSRGVFSVVSARDGSLWVGVTDGVNQWTKGRARVYRTGDSVEALFQDAGGRLWAGTQKGVAFLQSDRFVPVTSVPYGIVYSFAGDDAANVWVSHQDGLFHLFQGRVIERTGWAALGRTQPATALLHDEAHDGLWLGFRNGGIAYLKDGQLRASYAGADGLGEGEVRGFYRDAAGTLWAATEGGLSRIQDGRILTLTRDNGLPCNTVHWMMEDDADSIWLYLACGLVRVQRSELDAWTSHPKKTIQTTVFDTADGVSKHAWTGGYYGVVAKSPDGKLWFVRHGGIGVIDPRHLRVNTLAPPVHIEQVTADDKAYDSSNVVWLPPHVRNLAIEYTALSVVAPERNRFRVKLEGRDSAWQDVGTRRQAFYTDLPPGSYRFRVVASNNSGVWNETGAALDFSIAPAFYQTRWFAALVVICAGALLFAAYRLRVAQLARQFNRTLDTRVSERTRIARDLHDTLLQSFQGALLRFQSVAKVINTRPDEASERLERALDQAEAAITEGRNAVRGLRASATTVNDLANGIAAIGAELTSNPAAVAVPAIEVAVDGASRDLKPLVRDEAFRIASEALRNAVKHAQARHIVVTVGYEPRQLRLTIHDDGKGIDTDTLARQQVEGHFGLPGMQERAAVVKGRLDVSSGRGEGTTIELRVPAAIAYATSAPWWSRLVGLFVAASLLLAICPRALALNASLDVRQYAHTSWSYRDGFVTATVYAFAQTPDGYLWMATGAGVVRFDGVRAIPLGLAPAQHLPSTAVFSLLAEDDGTLWIGTFDGLASWKNGVLTTYAPLAGFSINAILRDRDGTLWVGAYGAGAGTLCTIRGDRTSCFGEQRTVGSAVGSLYEDPDGVLWVNAITGLWRWKPGPPTRIAADVAPPGRVFARGDDRSTVLEAMGDVRQLVGDRFAPYPLQGAPSPLTATTLLRDRSGGIWVGTSSHGLVHASHGHADVFDQHDGLSSDQVIGMFEDREGSIWVSTAQGIDRFRELPVLSLRPTELSNANPRSILASRDGSIWIGTRDGLNRWSHGHVTVYRKATHAGLPDDSVDSLHEDERGRIWVSGFHGLAAFEDGRFVPVPAAPVGNKTSIATDGHGGLWLGLDQTRNSEGLVHLVNGTIVEQFSLRDTDGGSGSGLVVDPNGGVWLGLLTGGMAHFGGGQIRKLPLTNQPGTVARVMNVFRDRDGAVWAASETGAVRIANGSLATLSTANGLPCDAVHWMIDDDTNHVWLYTRCGLIRLARSEVAGWIVNPKQVMHPTVFGPSDGIRLVPIPTASRPAVAKATDGRIWFLNGNAVSVIDPAHLGVNTLPPPVHIEQLVVDRRPYAATPDLPLPPRVRDLQIDYTALSLVAPEKNRFRVRLEGRDAEWQDVGTRRQAFYTDLGPGSYRFRVVASNNSDVWNEAGDTLSFSIAPAYYQTRWFAALVLAAAGGLLWLAYERRMRQVAQEFNSALAARVNERTRIARDLHDTLLQSFQGTLLRFQSVANVIRSRPDEASARLERALQQAEAAITEGRNAVQGLRTSAAAVNDLANDIAAIGAELTGDPTTAGAPVVTVEVDGAARDLNPVVRDEGYRIAAEAIRNAAKHARARHVVVTIHYEARQFRLAIQDDGKGIDAETLARQQVNGHFGLPGMRERASVVKGQLDVRSAPGAGTEVELRVPAAIAYGKTGRATWWARVIAVFALVLGPSLAHGQQLSQYAHTAWKLQQGVIDASPVSIAQTTDGFLWIGTLNGLIRFDGVRFESWNERFRELHTCCAFSLLASRDGSLWIGTGAGLAKLNGDRIAAVTNGDARYNSLIEDRNGRIWAARSRIRDNKGPLCELEGSGLRCHGQHDGLGCQFGNVVTQDGGGSIWVGDQGRICSWKDGTAAAYSPSADDTGCKPSIESLLADSDGSILIGCEGSLRRLRQGRFIPFELPSLAGGNVEGATLLHDRRGALWIGTTNAGLYRVTNGVAEHFGTAEGLSDDHVSALFEDREGNIWVLTPEGIDRLNRVSVVSFSDRQGLRGTGAAAVLASRDGQTIWTAGVQGLAALRNGNVTAIARKDGLPGQQVTALFEDDRGVLWMGIDQDLFAYAKGRFTKTIRSDGKPTSMVVGMAQDANRVMWIVTTGSDRLLRLNPGTATADVVRGPELPSRIAASPNGTVYVMSIPSGTLFVLRNGATWESVPLPTGPRTGQRLLVYDEDSVFVATAAGLYRWRKSGWSSLTAREGLPCAAVQDAIDDQDGGLWLHLPCGFVHIAKRDVDAWSRGTTARLNLEVYDALDGARAGGGNFEPSHARTAGGQLWFATGSTLQMIDPRNLARNEVPPPVHIERLTVDGHVYPAADGVRLPPGVRDVSIDFTALSFVAPEKVHFRYLLEGQDRDWKEVVNDRRVQYSNLRPRSYRFRVAASNNRGVWNETGASLDFWIAPSYYQTRWFAALVVVAIATLLWVAHRLRVAQLSAQFNRTLDARVSERTRIARELHDTMMQSFQASVLRVHSAANILLTRPAEAKARLDRALNQADAAIAEGRHAVQGLRASATTRNDLADGIAAIGAELTGDLAALSAPAIQVDIDGESRDLNPLVREETYRIAGEALRNAVKHANARRVVVTIHYEPRQLRLAVRDDGKGIDAETMARQQVAGHFGLPGMRERAAIIKGRLDVRSTIGAGTEIELRVPGAIAYGRSARLWRRLSSFARTEEQL